MPQKVIICLATFNAEKHLRAQLESIQKQTYSDWICNIRDDQSTDGTLAIIDEFVTQDSRFRLINPGKGKNLGGHRTFFELVKYEAADFYVLCDADDVWKTDKLAVYLAACQNKDAHRPLLVYSTWTTVDEELTFLKENDQKTVLAEQIAFNQINGMAIMINHALAKAWQFEPIGAHDSYLGTLAYAIGDVVYIPVSTTLWRRQAQSESLNNYGRQYGIATFWQMMDTSFKRAQLIYQDCQAQMAPQIKTFFEQFIALDQASFFQRLALLFSLKLRRKSVVETIAMTLLLLTNFQKPQEGKDR
ncbi:glycosyltransferase [Streptococcus halichoeri]|uniref:glycosyltransferase n=1 Tax=Streptococcus halichoeri TaxID=254785 RepID=UPI00135A4C8E|nr:glycosyltransferase [Streptococcus halichoeri]